MAPQKDSKETWIFVGHIAGVFILTLVILGVVGLLPKELLPTFSPAFQNPPARNTAPASFDVPTFTPDPVITTATKPVHVQIPEVGVNINIMQPDSPRVDILDEALKQGAVYYPGSGTIEQGTIYLFGHSSNWKVVKNQAYRAFSDVDKLSAGSEIYLTADNKLYVYEVETVSHVDANVGYVDLSQPGRRLVISTCDTFGEKSDRWVVTAVFKEVQG